MPGQGLSIFFVFPLRKNVCRSLAFKYIPNGKDLNNISLPIVFFLLIYIFHFWKNLKYRHPIIGLKGAPWDASSRSILRWTEMCAE
jgi:hypothetical protein